MDYKKIREMIEEQRRINKVNRIDYSSMTREEFLQRPHIQEMIKRAEANKITRPIAYNLPPLTEEEKRELDIVEAECKAMRNMDARNHLHRTLRYYNNNGKMSSAIIYLRNLRDYLYENSFVTKK